MAYHEAREKVRFPGAEVADAISLPLAKELTVGDDYAPFLVNCMWTPSLAYLFPHDHCFNVSDAHTAYELEESANDFLREYTEKGSEVRDLATMVAFNKEHAEACLPKSKSTSACPKGFRVWLTHHVEAPDQSYLIKAIENRPSEGQYRHAFEHTRKIGRDEGLDKAFGEHDLDVVLAPMDSPVCSLSMASGSFVSFPILEITWTSNRCQDIQLPMFPSVGIA